MPITELSYEELQKQARILECECGGRLSVALERLMPEIGEIKNAKEIRVTTSDHKVIWSACVDCGKQRWVDLLHGKPVRTICHRCASNRRISSQKRIPDDKDLLYELYWNKRTSMNIIGKLYGVGPGVVKAKLKNLGIPTRNRQQGQELHAILQRGSGNPCWNGGRTQNGKGGYVFIYKPGHPHAHQNYVRENVLVWEESHGRPIPKGWEVHHLNGILDDNRPENLVGLPSHKHKLVLAALKKRIRELESKNKLYEKTLREKQLIFIDTTVRVEGKVNAN